jgi:phosphoglycerate dehydrogenase-like enzyme
MIQVVFCGTGWLPMADAIRQRLPDGAAIRVRDLARPLEDEVRDAHVILPSNASLSAEAINAPPDLLLIQQPAAGYEAIDLDAARRRGVPVCNAPGCNSQAVVEAALLLMLALARRLPRAQHDFSRRRIGEPVGSELAGRTLGVVGLGRIGARLAEIAGRLGMQVLAVRSSSSRADLNDLLARSDFVSLHCPLTPATRGLIDSAAFERMKPGAFLVNCARGAIVDRAALERALASGRLAGAGLDTFWEEPWDPADPLYAREDVIVLPHVGGSTEEAFTAIAQVVVENIARVLRGEAPLHRVA